jgi:hypothetical protein
MIFADLLAGASVFLDANIFVYHFTLHSRFGPACTSSWSAWRVNN